MRNRPQQNGVAERANIRLLGERITAMLSEAGLSKAFWAECLASLVHVLDRCPTSALQGATSYELWNKKKPNVGLDCILWIFLMPLQTVMWMLKYI